MAMPRMPRVTSGLVGPERFMDDAFAHALVINDVPCDDAVVMLLEERDRLLTELTQLKRELPNYRFPL